MPHTLLIQVVSPGAADAQVRVLSLSVAGEEGQVMFDPVSRLHVAHVDEGLHRVVVSLGETYLTEDRIVEAHDRVRRHTFHPIPKPKGDLPPGYVLRSGARFPIQIESGLLAVASAEGEPFASLIRRATQLLRRARPFPLPASVGNELFDRSFPDLPVAPGIAPANWARAFATEWAARGLPLPEGAAASLTAQGLGAPHDAIVLMPWDGRDVPTLVAARAMRGFAGPAVQLDRRSAALLPAVSLALRPSLRPAEVARITQIMRPQPTRIEPLEGQAGLFMLEFAATVGFEIVALAQDLATQHPEAVLSADVEVAIHPVADGNAFTPLLWHLEKLGQPAALALATADGRTTSSVSIAVFDKSFNGLDLTRFPDCDRSLASSSPTATRSIEHGAMCVAAAAALDPDVPGVAPGARVILAKPGPRTEPVLRPLERAAGLVGPLGGPPADIISASLAVGSGVTAVVDVALKRLARRGRDHRGCVIFMSAGNGGRNSHASTARPMGAAEEVLSCGATSLIPQDGLLVESLASYSSEGAELCAPSSMVFPANEMEDQPILVNRLGEAGAGLALVLQDCTADRLRFVTQPNCQFDEFLRLSRGDEAWIAHVTGTPAQDAPADTWSVAIELLGERTDPDGFLAFLAEPNVDVARLADVAYFGGTSASTPICAGVAALMLTANPALPWTMVHAILKQTAVNTGILIQGEEAQFGASDLNAFLGSGRVYAHSAVEAALAYTNPTLRVILTLRRADADVDTFERGATHTLALVLARDDGEDSPPVAPVSVRILVCQPDAGGFVPAFPDGWDAVELPPAPATDWGVKPRWLAEPAFSPTWGGNEARVQWDPVLVPPGNEVALLVEITPQLGVGPWGTTPGTDTNPNLSIHRWPIVDPIPPPDPNLL